MEIFLTFLSLGLLNYKVSDTENVTCQPLTAESHTEQIQNMLAMADNSPRNWFLSFTFPEVNKNSLFFPSRHVYITTPLFFTNRFSRSDGMYPRKSSPQHQPLVIIYEAGERVTCSNTDHGLGRGHIKCEQRFSAIKRGEKDKWSALNHKTQRRQPLQEPQPCITKKSVPSTTAKSSRSLTSRR